MHWGQTEVKRENAILKHFSTLPYKEIFKKCTYSVMRQELNFPHGSVENLLLKLSETSFIEGTCLEH